MLGDVLDRATRATLWMCGLRRHGAASVRFLPCRRSHVVVRGASTSLWVTVSGRGRWTEGGTTGPARRGRYLGPVSVGLDLLGQQVELPAGGRAMPFPPPAGRDAVPPRQLGLAQGTEVNDVVAAVLVASPPVEAVPGVCPGGHDRGGDRTLAVTRGEPPALVALDHENG